MSDGEGRQGGLTGTVIRGVSIAGGGFLLGRLVTLITFVVLARLVTPEELGQYTSGSILVGFGLLLAGSGMLAALIHREDRLEEAASTATVATIGAGVVLALLSVAVAPLFAVFFGSETVGEVAAVSSGILFLQSARTVPNAILQRRFSFMRRLIVEPVAMLAFGIASIIATSQGLGVWGLVIGMYAQASVDVALSWGLVRWRPRWRQVSFAMWRELVAYGRHVLAGTAVRRFGERIPSSSREACWAERRRTAPVREPDREHPVLADDRRHLLCRLSGLREDRDRSRPVQACLPTDSLRWSTLVVAHPLGLILVRSANPWRWSFRRALESWPARSRRRSPCSSRRRAIAAEHRRGLQGSRHPGEVYPSHRDRGRSGAIAMLARTPLLGLFGVGIGISVDAIAGATVAIVLASRAMEIPVRDHSSRSRRPRRPPS